MPKKIAIVVGHARQGSYCEALGEAYCRGAQAGGHEVSLFNTATMTFDPVLHHGYEKPQELEPDLKKAHDAILAADHLVMIFPLWLGTLPAIFKGFLERVLIAEIMGPMKEGRFATPLKGKSARVVVTMGMPGFVYRWWYGAHALKVLKRNILGFVGASPVRSTVHGYIEGVSEAKRHQWLQEMEDMGRRAE